jgi:2-oxoglutarate-dependent dioxygenase
MRKPTAADVERFQREGYFAVGPVLNDRELAEIRAAYDRIFTATEKPATYRNLAQRAGEEQSKGAVLQIIDMYKLDEAFRRLHDRGDLLDWVEAFVGSPNVCLYHDQALFKPALHGDVVPWHQDNGYWKLAPPTAASIWIALDDATVENGCMWVVPGSQQLGATDHERAGDFSAQLETKADESRAVAIPCSAGSAMFHHCQTLHRTLPNTSPRPRRAFVMHFMAAGTQQNGKVVSGRPLLRGTAVE